jgi:predicted nuclease of predicted toxin-antitoxin system
VGLNDCDDIEIWLFAKNNDFTIVTVDADFFDLAIVKGFPPKVIWFRTGNLTTSEISEILRLNSQRIKSFIDDNDSSCLEII